MKQRIITPSPINMGFRVLVGTPTSDHKLYCQDEFIYKIKRLSYPHYDIFIADNSQDRKNQKSLMKQGINFIHIKPRNKPIQQVIADSHEAIRQHFLRGRYDYLLHLESDVMPTSDIIERLMIHNKPIVSACYFISEGTNSHLMIQQIEDWGEIREMANIKDGADMNMMDGKLHQVFACGLGACLIRRDVVEKIPFRWSGGDIFPDSYFSFDANSAGFAKFVDTSLLLEHKNSSWTEKLLTNSIYNL